MSPCLHSYPTRSTTINASPEQRNSQEGDQVVALLLLRRQGLIVNEVAFPHECTNATDSDYNHTKAMRCYATPWPLTLQIKIRNANENDHRIRVICYASSQGRLPLTEAFDIVTAVDRVIEGEQ